MGTLQFIRQNLQFLSAGLLLTFASCFGQTFFISIFAGEIQAEFGLSHGAWGGIYMIGTLASAIVMIWAGVLTDIFRVRVLGPIVLVVMSLACLAMATVSTLWLLPIVVFALRLTGQGMLSHISAVAMARWYVAERGRALAISSFGFLIGEALLPILFVAALTMIGWRWSWTICAVVALTTLPLLMVLLKQERTPQTVASQNQSTGMGGKQWTRPEVLRHWMFWFLLPFLMGPSAFGTAFFFHQVHLADVKGWSHLQFVTLFPIYTTVSLVVSMITGFAIDRLGAGRLIPFAQIPMALGFVVFSLSPSLVGAAIGVALFGVTSGMNATLPSAFWAEYFGTKHLGAIKAMAAAVMVLGSAIGPGLTGWIIDQGMDYNAQMLWVAIYFGFAAILARIAIRKANAALPNPAQIDV